MKHPEALVEVVIERMKKVANGDDATYAKLVDEKVNLINESFKAHEKTLRDELDKILGLMLDGYSLSGTDDLEKAIDKFVKDMKELSGAFLLGNIFLNRACGKTFTGFKTKEN
jgi:hypothetical protein